MQTIIPNDRLLREIWSGIPTGIALVARDGTFMRVSPSYCAFLGFTEGELQRLKFADITLQSDRAADIEAANALADRLDEEGYRMVKTYTGKFGAPLRCIIDVQALRTVTGEFLAYLVFCQPLAAGDYKIEQSNGSVFVRPTFDLLAFWRDNRRSCVIGGAILISLIHALDFDRLTSAWKVLKSIFFP